MNYREACQKREGLHLGVSRGVTFLKTCSGGSVYIDITPRYRIDAGPPLPLLRQDSTAPNIAKRATPLHTPLIRFGLLFSKALL